MRRYYREKKYICGDYADIQIYPVYPSPKGRLTYKKKPTSEVQAKLNAENAKKKLLRLVHTNFKPKDYEVTFTYTKENMPTDEEAAKKDIQNFYRRAKRLYKKADIELKYIWIMERGEKTGNIHFHAFMTGGIDRTELEMLWGFGYANTKALRFSELGVASLVYYDTKDKPLTYRRWSCSKNLKKPEERQNDHKVTRRKAKELHEEAERSGIAEIKKIYPQYEKTLKEYEIADIVSQHNQFNGDYYILLRLYKTG